MASRTTAVASAGWVPSAVVALLTTERSLLRTARLRWRRFSLCFIRLIADLVLATGALLLGYWRRCGPQARPDVTVRARVCQGVCLRERLAARRACLRGGRRGHDGARHAGEPDPGLRTRHGGGPGVRRRACHGCLLRGVPHPQPPAPPPFPGSPVHGDHPGLHRS